jgi:GNAT superfamily N-acetyltransferase
MQSNNANARDISIIDLTPQNIADYGVCGYKDVKKHVALQRKIAWFSQYYPKGLRIKALISSSGGYQGMLEYIPGKYAHRPVHADSYMFIHCIFVGFKKEYKGKGYASLMLDECIQEAKTATMDGVAVVTRKGAFMVAKDFFLKKGFSVVDRAKPDFELLSLKFSNNAVDPSFREMTTQKYDKGLTIMRSPQCPYSVTNVNAIMESAKKMGLSPNLVELTNAELAQQSPCAFGTFCIVCDGVVVSHHPISNTRFENIMKKSALNN